MIMRHIDRIELTADTWLQREPTGAWTLAIRGVARRLAQDDLIPLSQEVMHAQGDDAMPGSVRGYAGRPAATYVANRWRYVGHPGSPGQDHLQPLTGAELSWVFLWLCAAGAAIPDELMPITGQIHISWDQEDAVKGGQ